MHGRGPTEREREGEPPFRSPGSRHKHVRVPHQSGGKEDAAATAAVMLCDKRRRHAGWSSEPMTNHTQTDKSRKKAADDPLGLFLICLEWDRRPAGEGVPV